MKLVDDQRAALGILAASMRGRTESLMLAHGFATLVPASAAVPTAAADQQDNYDDDEKCRGVHNALLAMLA
jgi:uncharacterized membrane protein